MRIAGRVAGHAEFPLGPVVVRLQVLPAETEAETPKPTAVRRSWWRTIALTIGALAFVFPFYYMIVGSLQKKSDTSLKGVLPLPGNLSLHNYSQINAAISLGQTLLNSIIFAAGVILGTVVFGILAGYALAQLHYRGRGTLFAAMLLLQVIPFQLLIIPLYVQIVRSTQQPHPDRTSQGLLAERLHVNVADAFAILRATSRSHNRRLSDLAQAIVDGTEQLPARTSADRRPGGDG